MNSLMNKTSGRLTVIGESSRSNKVWVVCICGTDKQVFRSNFLAGTTTSCGCLQREQSALRLTRLNRRRTVHGYAQQKAKKREYRIWCAIKTRCTNPRAINYKYYGGRGIRLCYTWKKSFAAFLRDMGPCPSPAHSIDRICNDRGYDPENCRWATKQEQARNQRRYQS